MLGVQRSAAQYSMEESIPSDAAKVGCVGQESRLPIGPLQFGCLLQMTTLSFSTDVTRPGTILFPSRSGIQKPGISAKSY